MAITKPDFIEYLRHTLQVNSVARNRLRFAAAGGPYAEDLAKVIRDIPARFYAKGAREQLMRYYEEIYGPFPYPKDQCR
ncbi:MAG: hypothetical protein H9W81_09905 [Enterococcus sp.]|nr:hypothetical protein [Enterococcus sp.]